MIFSLRPISPLNIPLSEFSPHFFSALNFVAGNFSPSETLFHAFLSHYKLRSLFNQIIKNTKALYWDILYIYSLKYIYQYSAKVFLITEAKNYRSLFGQNCMKKCFQEKNFPRWNLTGPKIFGENIMRRKFRRRNSKWRNCTRWKYHAPNIMRVKCHAAKFNAGKM